MAQPNMLNENEAAMLESLIRRMTDKQRAGLEAWLSNDHDGHGGWTDVRPLGDIKIDVL
jgi:hypothetical protein